MNWNGITVKGGTDGKAAVVEYRGGVKYKKNGGNICNISTAARG